MSDCTQLSERIPVVALGQSGWTSEEAAHLRACSSCRQEWDLVRRANHLGQSLLSSLDGPGTAKAVLQRLEYARTQRSRHRAWGLATLAAAAALIAVVWSGSEVGPRPATPAQPLAARLEIILPELDSLQPAELDSVLQTMDQTLVDGWISDSTELQSVLDYWEG
jgi:hypothetical protein